MSRPTWMWRGTKLVLTFGFFVALAGLAFGDGPLPLQQGGGDNLKWITIYVGLGLAWGDLRRMVIADRDESRRRLRNLERAVFGPSESRDKMSAHPRKGEDHG